MGEKKEEGPKVHEVCDEHRGSAGPTCALSKEYTGRVDHGGKKPAKKEEGKEEAKEEKKEEAKEEKKEEAKEEKKEEKKEEAKAEKKDEKAKAAVMEVSSMLK